MAKGWMSKDPSEMTARQQRRMQFLEKRGRGGQVQAQPTEMPEMTARQQRRQHYVANRDARRQRAVEDWRAQQAGQQLGRFPGFPEGLPEGIQPYPLQLTPEQQREFKNNLLGGSFRSDNPQDPNIYSQSPDGRIVGTYMSYPGMGAGGPTFNKRLDIGNPMDAALRMTPEESERYRTLFSSGFGGQGYGNMLGQLPAGQTQGQAVGAAMGQRGMNAARPYGTNHWSYNRR